MIRKVKLNRSQVEMAKSMNIPLEDAAKILSPKRGRPVGSKNKRKKLKVTPISEFQKTLNQWDEAEKKVDFKDLCQKLQEALAKSYCDYEQLEKNAGILRDEIIRRDIIIQYLESRRA